MPTFSTPEPILVALAVAVGNVRVTATERRDTVVDVCPTDPAHDADVRAAEQTRVDYADGTLGVRMAKPGARGLFGRTGSADITIALPAGSRVQGKASVAALRTAGPLGDCRIKIGAGDIQLEQTAATDVSTGAGAIFIHRVTGDAQLATGSGDVRLRSAGGAAVVKNSNGDSWIGEVFGDLQVRAANGDITVDRAHASVSAATANGDVRVGDAARGSASLRTGIGEIEIGIRAGTAARLDVQTGFGSVRNELTAASPQPTDQTLDVRARTGHGDIVVRRP